MEKFIHYDIPLVSCNWKEVETLVTTIIDAKRRIPVTVSFVNPEIILKAHGDRELCEYLHETMYNFIDGIGIILLEKLFKRKIENRITGTDFMPFLIRLCNIKNQKVFFLGGETGIAEKAAKILSAYTNTNVICGTHHGFFKKEEEKEIINKIIESKTDVLVVCLGFPRQEHFIKRNLNYLENLKLVFGNGGALDFWSYKRKRAPKIIIDAHLEWFYRFLQEPTFSRLRRQLKLIFYPFKFILWKIFFNTTQKNQCFESKRQKNNDKKI